LHTDMHVSDAKLQSNNWNDHILDKFDKGRFNNKRSLLKTICDSYLKIDHIPVLSTFMTYHRICDYNNRMGATNGAGTAYPSGAHEFNPGF
jgi:hypothetical protein